MSGEDFTDRELRLAADAFASGWAGARDLQDRSQPPSAADPMGPFGVLLGVMARHSRQGIEEGYVEKVLSALEEAMKGPGEGGTGTEEGSLPGVGEASPAEKRVSPAENLWEHPRPRGYERWVRRAAAAITGRDVEWAYAGEEVLLEWLSPGWPAAIVGAEESDDCPEDPAERARHRVWALHRAVGFARESLQIIVEVSPTSPDPDERGPGTLLEPETAKVYALNWGADDPEGGFVITELGILGADQTLLAEKEEPLSNYSCRNGSELRRLHARIYRWLPETQERRRVAAETAEQMLPIVEDLIARFGRIGSEGYEARIAARLNLEYEIDDIRVALDSLHLDLEEISETGLLAEELDDEEEWEDGEE